MNQRFIDTFGDRGIGLTLAAERFGSSQSRVAKMVLEAAAIVMSNGVSITTDVPGRGPSGTRPA